MPTSRALSRRQLLRYGAVAGAALAVPLWPEREAPAAPAGTAEPVDPLPRPVVVDGSLPVAMAAANATHRFASWMGAAATLQYRVTAGRVLDGGSEQASGWLGPVVVATRGTPTAMTVANAVTHHPLAASFDPSLHGLGPADADHLPIAVHLHGGNSRLADDGDPVDAFRPGGSHSYRYDNQQEATGLWYHDHVLGLTRLNVYAGLAGLYLIRDAPGTGVDTGDGRVLPPPPYEIPLVLQDRSFTAAGALDYPPAPWQPEFYGFTAVVNGIVHPYLDVDRGVYRFRLYNGSNARFYKLTLQPRGATAPLPFWQIGADGGLLDAPAAMTALVIAPGERADLLVDFRPVGQGAVVEVLNGAAAPDPSMDGGVASMHRILQFRVTGRSGWAPPGPIGGTSLRPTSPLPRLERLRSSARVRTHSLVEIAGAGAGEMMVTLDNRMFDDQEFTSAPVQPNSLELWELVNTTEDVHPIHLHLVQFQVLDRQKFDAARYLAEHYADPVTGEVGMGSGPYPAPPPGPYLTGPAWGPAANEQGWKDTVQSFPGTVTRILVPFGSIPGVPVASPAAPVGDFVWHCHILEHEDNDMMQRFRIA